MSIGWLGISGEVTVGMAAGTMVIWRWQGTELAHYMADQSVLSVLTTHQPIPPHRVVQERVRWGIKAVYVLRQQCPTVVSTELPLVAQVLSVQRARRSPSGMTEKPHTWWWRSLEGFLQAQYSTPQTFFLWKRYQAKRSPKPDTCCFVNHSSVLSKGQRLSFYVSCAEQDGFTFLQEIS